MQLIEGTMASKATPTILDVDVGVDDCLSILMALASPEIELVGITSTFGNTDVDATTANIFRTFNALEQHLSSRPQDRSRFVNLPGHLEGRETKPIPIARGAEGPIEGPLRTAKYFHGRDGLCDITTRFPEMSATISSSTASQRGHESLAIELSTKDAADLIIELVRAHPPNTVNLVCVGPLTNLALAVKRVGVGEDGLGRIGRVIVMGGVFDVTGNVSPVAVFNTYADPYALDYVLRAGMPRVLLCPLDITTTHTLPFNLYERVVDKSFATYDEYLPVGKRLSDSESPLATFTSMFLSGTRKRMKIRGKDGMDLHDPLALWYAICNPPRPEGSIEGWQTTRRSFMVECHGKHTKGMLVVDRRAGTVAHGSIQSTSVVAGTSKATTPDETEVSADVLTATPGSDKLVALLLARVWGVVPA